LYDILNFSTDAIEYKKLYIYLFYILYVFIIKGGKKMKAICNKKAAVFAIAAILILVSSVQGINLVGVESVTDDSVNVNEGISLLDLDATIDNENYIIDLEQPQPTNILGSTITIYVNTSAIDGRNDLNESQKTALKQHILDHIKSNFEGALGSGNVTVTDDPSQQGGADRNVSIEPGMSDPPGSAWGQCHGGNNTVKVFLGEFMNDSSVNGSFQNPDGSWNITKLGNAIGHTAGHEVAHTYSVGHNHEERPKPPDFLPPDENDNRSKMTAGENINATERANMRFDLDNHTIDVIGNNLGKDACVAFPDYDMKVLLAHYFGPTTLPDKPDEAGSLDVTFDFYTEMAGHFELGFLGEDTDDGLHDGNSEFDFIYKTSLLRNEDIDAKILTFISEFHDHTTWLLRGAEDGKWFMLDPENVILSDFIVTPDGDTVARKVAMAWPEQGVSVFFDALSFGKASNPHNGFTYDFVEWKHNKMHFPQLPDEDGWDVYATAGLGQYGYPEICLADDWLCTETGPVTDIHFWGSWKGGIEGNILAFVIAIAADIPADPTGGIPYSRPGETLWEWTFYKWDSIPIDPPCMEGWYNPSIPEIIYDDHQAYFQYNIVDIPQPFIQRNGVIYWLAISAIVEYDATGFQPLWGWKSTEDHWNDDACWAYWGELNWIDIWEPAPRPIINHFMVQFDPMGKFVFGDGSDYYDDGTSIMNGWYFYPNTDWYNIWFYDHPFDPARYKEINIWFDAFQMEQGPALIEVAVNWATDQWPPDSPPPIPPLTPENESRYVGRYTLFKETYFEGHYEFTFTIPNYNPEWVSIDVRGYNFVIPAGQIIHDCLPKIPQSLDLAFVITGEPWYFKPAYPNYAPSGMPDFDQKQNMWKAINDGGNGIAETTATGDDIQVAPAGSTVNPGDVVVAPGPNCKLDTQPIADDIAKWAFCGPTAVANCFWWFDSKYADPTGWPGDGKDTFPLVENYGVKDDHSSSNVPLLIEKLAGAMGTCSKGTTHIDDMQLAIDNWFNDTGLDDMFEETTYNAPTFEFIESEIERSQDVILLLGYYDYEEPVKIIDQQQTLWETNDNLQTVTWGDYQSFTPMVSTLDAIQLCLVSNGDPCDIEINVYDSGRNLIGSLIHNPGFLPIPTWYQFHFASTIPLKDETHYFDVRQIVDGYHYEWFYMPYDPYTGGQGWMDTKPTDYYGNPFDWTFKTEYFESAPGCVRKRGHYVTCAGVSSDMFKIALSDPYWNINNPSPNDHNDAQYVSHDIYKVSLGSPCPQLPYQWWLPDYPADYDYTIVEQAVVICPKDATPPVISDVTLTTSDPLDTDPLYGWENVTCNVTDNVLVNQVNLVVTDPNATTVEYAMANILGTDTYYYNTTFTQPGNYSYYVWADDFSGNNATSSPEPFILPPNYEADMDYVTRTIDFWDLVEVVKVYGNTGSFGWIREDVDNNGVVDFWDLVEVVKHYGESW